MTWPTVPLRRLVTCLDGRRIPLNSEQRAEMKGSVPYWGAGGVLDFVDQAIFNEPLVLLKEDGSPFFIPGKGVAHYVEGPSWINNHIHALRATGADGRFLAYALNCVDYSNYLTGSTRDKLTQEDLKKIDIWQPPLREQRRIADFLDAETARIDRLVALQVTLRARIDERDNALRDNLVNELARTVGEVPLRRFTTRIEQGASPQCEAIPRQGDDEWGVLKLSAVKGGNFISSENKRLPEGTEPISAYQVRRGDLLVTRANTPSLVGDVAVVESDHQKLLLPDLIYRVDLMPEMNADFVAQVALSGRVRTLIESVARGTSQSMVKLRGEDIKTWPMPMATQTQQATLVQEIQGGMQGTARLRTAVALQLSLLAERRQALITAAVTGQFDVSTASGRNVTDGVTA
ncbi:restriction endonuclease subunit S [Streptomyces sp. NPDC002467]|uniref:restriction endonuclease subunit S n=1 Tax=Streptomyces sp. NPDC002467 TaxID=3364647 RepID=UPI003682243A